MHSSTIVIARQRKAGHGRRRQVGRGPAVTTVIVVSAAALFGIALVASQLVRMREWLKNSPPLPPPIDDDSNGDDEP